MKYLILIISVILTSCLSFEDIEINVNVPEPSPIATSEAEVEIDFHILEGEIWSSLEPQFQAMSNSEYFEMQIDSRNLLIKLKKGKFVKFKNIWVDNCENSWFSIHYYSDTEAEIYLQTRCYQTIIEQEQIIFNLKISI